MCFNAAGPREDENEPMADGSDGWSFKIRERSVGVYEGVATHVGGGSITSIDVDPDNS